MKHMSHIKKQAKKVVKRSAAKRAPTPVAASRDWTYFSNHGHVLFCLAREPEMLLREVAVRVGVTERAVQRIVADLEAAGVLLRQRDGRRNRYTIDPNAPLRHPNEAHCTVGMLIDTVVGSR
ncbi:MAG: winged helix-turn-helix domain-containing protein [Thermomonas hydrothermalis]|nr:winged helix-turn-helix domain-containing protein [Thermomonas hydrothermalis]